MGLCRSWGDAGLQAGQAQHPSSLSLAVVAAVQSERVPKVGFPIEKIETRWHDSDDGTRRRVDLDLAADDPLVAAEPALPQAIADDQCGVYSRFVVLRREKP